ncbi:TerC family protein [Candidatus Peregrinibacteria bacterium]|nr:TerC family protein [Candidatus Peregrinibacteria bacterium]
MEFHDILTVATLALLEGILSVDNALVLAILVRPLPEAARKKALRWGIWGAFAFRLLAVIFASYLIQFEVFKLIGGTYLIYLAIKHMFFGLEGENQEIKESGAKAFWKVVVAVELTDIVFSIDSITTAVAFSDKLWVLWFGGVMGIILMRFLSGYFVKAIEKFPKLEDLAYQLVFFVGTKLAFETLGVHIEKSVFWIMMGVIGVIGASLVVREAKFSKHSAKRADELVKQLKAGEITVREALANHSEDGRVLAYLYKEGYLKELS